MDVDRLITQKYLLLHILNYLNPEEIFQLEEISDIFCINHPLAIHYLKVKDMLSIYNNSDYQGTLGREIATPYDNGDTKFIHYRHELLKELGLTEETLGDRFEMNTEQLEKTNHNLSGKIISSNDYGVPIRCRILVKTETSIKYLLSKAYMIDGIYLEYNNQKELEDGLNFIDIIDIEIGGQVINCHHSDFLKIYWYSTITKKQKNLLPLMAEMVNYNQPLLPFLTNYHDQIITIRFNEKIKVMPKLFLTGHLFDLHKYNSIIGLNEIRKERFFLQTQFTGMNSVDKKLTFTSILNFNFCMNAILISLSDFSDNIKTFTLCFDGEKKFAFDGSILSKDVPSSLGLSVSSKYTYYLLSFNNNLHPFGFNLESFKKSINFSRIDCVSYQIDFKKEFNGTVQVFGISTNIGMFMGGMYRIKYVS